MKRKKRKTATLKEDLIKKYGKEKYLQMIDVFVKSSSKIEK